jgi:hypothetical protein
MAGRPKKIRSIQSYINRSDANSGLGMLKEGFPPRVGNTRNFWHNYQVQSSPGPNSFINSPIYYKTLQWQRYGNLRPPFRPSPRTSAYTNAYNGTNNIIT